MYYNSSKPPWDVLVIHFQLCKKMNPIIAYLSQKHDF